MPFVTCRSSRKHILFINWNVKRDDSSLAAALPVALSADFFYLASVWAEAAQHSLAQISGAPPPLMTTRALDSSISKEGRMR